MATKAIRHHCNGNAQNAGETSQHFTGIAESLAPLARARRKAPTVRLSEGSLGELVQQAIQVHQQGQTAEAVADYCYKSAGVDAIFPGTAFERRFRDIHTLSQQIQSRTAHFESVGQILLGIEPPGTFL